MSNDNLRSALDTYEGDTKEHTWKASQKMMTVKENMRLGLSWDVFPIEVSKNQKCARSHYETILSRL